MDKSSNSLTNAVTPEDKNLIYRETDAIGHAAMVNFIGEMPDRERMLALPGAHLHDYGKEARPARKLGHATVVSNTPAGRELALKKLLKLVR